MVLFLKRFPGYRCLPPVFHHFLRWSALHYWRTCLNCSRWYAFHKSALHPAFAWLRKVRFVVLITVSWPGISFPGLRSRQSGKWGWSFRLHQQEKEEQAKKLKSAIEQKVKADKPLASLPQAGLQSIIPGVIEALNFQARQWAQGFKGLDIKENIIKFR